MLVHADPSDGASFERAVAEADAARIAEAADTATRESQVAMAWAARDKAAATAAAAEADAKQAKDRAEETAELKVLKREATQDRCARASQVDYRD